MWMLQAVNEGFEPTVGFPTPVFKTGTINQTLPINHVYLLHFQCTIIVICIFPATARQQGLITGYAHHTGYSQRYRTIIISDDIKDILPIPETT